MARITSSTLHLVRPLSTRFLAYVEYSYWAYLLYLVLGPPLGFYAGDNSSALILICLTLITVLRAHPFKVIQAKSVLLALLVIMVSVFTLWLFHRELFTSSGIFLIRTLIKWLCHIIIINALIKKQGFFIRLTIIMFVAGLIVFFSTGFINSDGRLRIADGTILENSNSFGAWMGFCATAMVIWGLNNQKVFLKTLLLLGATFALYTVGLTVSRTSLFGAFTAMGLFFLVRTIRPRTVAMLVFNVMSIVVISYLISNLPIFDYISQSFQMRLDQETGRFVTWPVAIETLIQNPFGLGTVSFSKGIYVDGRYYTAHNAFLFLGLFGGVLPAFLLLTMYLLGLKNINWKTSMNDVIWMPALYIYTIIQINTSNLYFIELWAVAPLVYALDFASMHVLTKDESTHSFRVSASTKESPRHIPRS